MSFSGFLNTIVLLGALQGFIVSSLLFLSGQRKQSIRILAVLILFIALANFNLYGYYKDWFGSGLLVFITQLIPLVVPMTFGPLIYFYVQSTLDPSFRITKKHRVHYYPVLIDFVPTLTMVFYGIGLILKLVKNNPGPWGTFIDDYNVYADIPRWMSLTFYVWLTAKYLSEYKLKHQGALNGQAHNFKWLRQFTGVFMVFQSIWLVYLVPYVIPGYTDWMLATFNWYPLYIPMSVIIYWLGIKGYMVSQQQKLTDKKTLPVTAALPAALIEQVAASLTKAMAHDKAFLNPDLGLALMSEKTGIPQRTISSVINHHLQKSFNEYVNEYRINEFKEKISQPEMDKLTIAGIALECGFSSQATFQRVFKNSTGITPTEFISKKAGINENNAQIMF